MSRQPTSEPVDPDAQSNVSGPEQRPRQVDKVGPIDLESAPDVGFDPEDLERLLEWQMPFGRFAGRTLIDLPEEYLMWFAQREFPQGDLGRLMRLCYGIKIHGADVAVKELRHRLQELSEDLRSPTRQAPHRRR